LADDDQLICVGLSTLPIHAMTELQKIVILYLSWEYEPVGCFLFLPQFYSPLLTGVTGVFHNTPTLSGSHNSIYPKAVDGAQSQLSSDQVPVILIHLWHHWMQALNNFEPYLRTWTKRQWSKKRVFCFFCWGCRCCASKKPKYPKICLGNHLYINWKLHGTVPMYWFIWALY